MRHATLYIADSRSMHEVADESVGLIVTSPPYWHLKDYGVPQQIGYGQSLHEYLYDLARVWCECGRVLQSGRRLCIYIGDQFARAAIYEQYKLRLRLRLRWTGVCLSPKAAQTLSAGS